MSLDHIIDIDISLASPAVSRQGFGTPLIGCHSLPVGFTERIRFYASAAEAAADTDLTADAQARLTTGFAQSPAPNQIAIGRLDDDQAQIVEFTVTGAITGTYTITINGIAETFAAVVPADTPTTIAAGLAAAINGNPTLAAVVTASPAAAVCTVTADVAGTAFTYSSAAPAGGSMTEAETQANLSVATSLDAILAENSNWYGLCLDTRATFLANNDLEIERAAAWTEANLRLFFGQSASADIATSVSSDIASELKAASYRRTALLYYTDNAGNADIAWLATFLANDFDSVAPTAAFQTLEGIATEELGSSVQNILDGKNANYYTTLKGVGATANALVAGGYDIELIVTADWVKARASESIAQLFLNTANAGSRIYYNNQGFQQVGGLVLAVLKNGEVIGHFNSETSQILVPELSTVSASDRSAGILRMEFGSQYSGRVKEVIIQGYISTDFTSLT